MTGELCDRTVRTNTLRALAERAATHPEIERAVMGAILGVLPAVLEQLIAQEAERSGNHRLRLYGRRVPSEERQARDQRVRALLAAGAHPAVVRDQVGCSLRHVYHVQASMRTATAKLGP